MVYLLQDVDFQNRYNIYKLEIFLEVAHDPQRDNVSWDIIWNLPYMQKSIDNEYHCKPSQASCMED